MAFLFNVLKFIAAWLVGILFSVSITMIGCCVFCALPILKDLKPYSGCIDVKRARRSYIRSIILHAVILACASWAVSTFAPTIMKYGFFLSFAFTALAGCGRWGRNEQNVSEVINNLQKYVFPGKNDEAFHALVKVLYR